MKAQTTEQILEQIKELGTITEQQINLLTRRMNNGEKIDVSYIWDNCPELTDEQNKKGFNFLFNQWKTPKGKERINSPFGYREEQALETFTGFELAGFYDAARYGQRPFYIPLYNCNGENGHFQYYFNGGKTSIVG